MQKSDLTEIEIELQDLKLRLARPGKTTNIQEAPAYREVVVIGLPNLHRPNLLLPNRRKFMPEILSDSPMVGTFYRKPSPEDGPFVQVGDPLRKAMPSALRQ